MPEECGNFHNLRDAVVGNPECVDHPSDYPSVRVCNELCGGVSACCLQIIERQRHPQPIEAPGDCTEELMRKACGGLEGLFNMAINPIFIELKIRLAVYAARINRILSLGLTVDPQLFDSYSDCTSQALRTFETIVGSVNLSGEGNFLVRAFFQTLVHDFRNKLTVAFGRSQLEVSKVCQRQKSRFEDCFATLPLLRATEHDLKLVSTPLSGLVWHCVTNFDRHFRESLPAHIDPGAVFNVQCLPPAGHDRLSTEFNAIVHPRVMEEIVREFLRNSVKAMPHGGDITVSVRRDGQNIVIDIADTGDGIPEENLEKIFQEGFTTREKTGSTGNGLFLALSYVEKILHGTITVESEIKKWTKFSISIQAAQSQELAA